MSQILLKKRACDGYNVDVIVAKQKFILHFLKDPSEQEIMNKIQWLERSILESIADNIVIEEEEE